MFVQDSSRAVKVTPDKVSVDDVVAYISLPGILSPLYLVPTYLGRYCCR